MADLFTPETATWGTPAMPSGRRGMNFTKEDLLAALVQAQNQPKSPYQLQFEAPTIAGPEPDREADFQNQWDQAMQAYQARVANPRILPPGITYAGQGGNLDTPEASAQATLAPFRFQAAEFSPGISRAFTEQDLEKQRQAELAAQASHWKSLEASQKTQRELAQKELERRTIADTFRRQTEETKAAERKQQEEDRLDMQRRISQARILGQTDPEAAVALLNSDESMPSPSRSGSVGARSPIPAATDIVPTDPKKRVAGQRYVTPRGTFTWTGTGWSE